MSTNFKIVKVDTDYCDYLRSFDNRVPYNAGRKDLRPFIGVLFMVGECEYFAPLSSPKEKHKVLKSNLDLVKIDDGNLGVINFNNMIPVKKKNYELFDLSKKSEDKSEMHRIALLNKQLRWLTKNRREILYKSKNLYTQYVDNVLPARIRNRCCNFPLLEEKCELYDK